MNKINLNKIFNTGEKNSEEKKDAPSATEEVVKEVINEPIVEKVETISVLKTDEDKVQKKKFNFQSLFKIKILETPEDIKKKAEEKKKKQEAKRETPAEKKIKEIAARSPKEKRDKEEKKELKTPLWRSRLSIKEQVHFAKRLAFLIRSGVPLMESLVILTKQAKSASRKRIFQTLEQDVANGRPLSLSLRRFKESFGDFTINLVHVGEMSGTLSKNLTYLAEELSKRQVLKRKVVGAMVYPAFITVATIGVTVLLTVYIFPKVMPIFTSLNVTLPFTTKVLLFMSNFLRSYGLYTLGALIISIIISIIVVKKSDKVHYFVNRNLLRLPVIGSLVQHYNMANFCRTLSLLLRSGFNVVEATVVTSDSTPNPVYKLECIGLHQHIMKGEKISKFLETKPKLFPDIVCHMVTIGETSGSLSDTLMYLSEHYEAELDDMVKNLSNSIEPVLMVFMGLLVGFVAVSVITPIYEVTQHLSR